MVTYGDGVADVNIKELLEFARSQPTLATITAARPHSKYGFLALNPQGNLITAFHEKPLMEDYVNSGFMYFRREAIPYFDDAMFEQTTLPRLAREGKLSAYRHYGFWKAMDTHKEMEELNALWETSRPWKIWQ